MNIQKSAHSNKKHCFLEFFLKIAMVFWVVSSTQAYSSPEKERQGSQGRFKYCISLDSITFYPFRERASAYENFYLLPLARSYISTDPSEDGLLSKWYFSPDGKVFTAQVSQTAKWQDGTQLTARDAALGIARGFLFRLIGGKVKVKGAEALLLDNWFDREVPGIKIISDDTFELTFESEVKNLSGVVRETLSTNSRPNRVWPARIDRLRKVSPNDYFDLISKFPVEKIDGNYMVSVHNQQVELATHKNCPGSDFYVYQDHVDSDIRDFSFSPSHAPQSLLAATNPSKPALRDSEIRRQLVDWLRSSYLVAEKFEAVTPASRHFEKNEAGFNAAIEPAKLPQPFPQSLPKALSIVSGNPLLPKHPLRRFIELQARAHQVEIRWHNFGIDQIDNSSVDIFLQGARHENGRQLWMQDALEFKPILPFLNQSPLVIDAFKAVAKFSSSTVPVDNTTLQNLEKATFKEAMVVPIARYNIVTYSKKTAPIELVHTERDELTFIKRKN